MVILSSSSKLFFNYFELICMNYVSLFQFVLVQILKQLHLFRSIFNTSIHVLKKAWSYSQRQICSSIYLIIFNFVKKKKKPYSYEIWTQFSIWQLTKWPWSIFLKKEHTLTSLVNHHILHLIKGIYSKLWCNHTSTYSIHFNSSHSLDLTLGFGHIMNVQKSPLFSWAGHQIFSGRWG